jgi:hypothetical protein
MAEKQINSYYGTITINNYYSSPAVDEVSTTTPLREEKIQTKYVMVVPIYKERKLTGETTFIDYEDYVRLGLETKRVYLNNKYPSITLNKKPTYLHKLILPVPLGKKVDHIDTNPLNNQRSNLREATSSQQVQNRNKFETMNGNATSSKFKGVSVNKTNGKWISKVGKNYFGTYSNEEEAARIYDREAKKLYGEFARINFTSDDEPSIHTEDEVSSCVSNNE